MDDSNFEDFMKLEEEMMRSAAQLSRMLDQVKHDLVAKGWGESQAESTSTVLCNTMVMMGGSRGF